MPWTRDEMAQRAAEGGLQVLFGKGVLGLARGDDRPLDEDGAVAEVGHAAEIVGRDQHDAAFGPQVLHQADDLFFGRDVDAGKGLVEQDDLAFLGERQDLLPAAFIIIAVTVTFYGVSASAFAKALGLRDGESQHGADSNVA